MLYAIDVGDHAVVESVVVGVGGGRCGTGDDGEDKRRQ